VQVVYRDQTLIEDGQGIMNTFDYGFLGNHESLEAELSQLIQLYKEMQ